MGNALKLFFSKRNSLEAGLDEAGRGCLAGPVYAAAVILDKDRPSSFLKELNDSKKLSAKKRSELRVQIEAEALAYSVAKVDADEIDKINILNASFLAMHKALDALTQRPDLLLIDGNRFHPYQNFKHQCIIKGDGLYYSIAAASVLAKTYRDEYMLAMHTKYPRYGWDRNKGYPSQEHKRCIKEFGPTPLHRRSFNWGLQLKLEV